MHRLGSLFNTGRTIPINTGLHNGFGLQLDRYQNFEELAQDAGHLRTRLAGITGNDFEWSIDAFAEKYETNLGHVGHQWERDEYNLEFRGNRPLVTVIIWHLVLVTDTWNLMSLRW